MIMHKFLNDTQLTYQFNILNTQFNRFHIQPNFSENQLFK